MELGTAIAYSPFEPVPAILILPAGAAAPSIISGPQPETCGALGVASFTVTATGSPLNYQWSLNGTNILGATSSSLTIPSVTQSNLGVYAVVVSNALGIATSNAVLSMYPFLASQFRGAVTYWGKDATFSVKAWGTGPLSYQWLKDGVAIAGATTNSLSLSSIQFTNAGLYSVVVSSALGSATNPPAQVVVNPAGVSLALYSGITIDGVVGLTYGIQYSTDLRNTNGWRGMANVTLSVPTELWFDVQPANQPQRYYRVVPGPITVP